VPRCVLVSRETPTAKTTGCGFFVECLNIMDASALCMQNACLKVDHIYRKATYMMNYIKIRCRTRKYSFDLDRTWILDRLLIGVCEATGIKFDFTQVGRTGIWRPEAPSIDRIDSSVGYMKHNCRMVILQYNMAKGQWADEDVMKFAQSLINAKGNK
jgi:hypothetical protein